MKSTYELKRFTNSKDPELVKALMLYSQNIEPAMRTDIREILYWVDKYNARFNDSFYILALYLNKYIIGFCQLAYFSQEKTVIVDYLVIEKAFRKNNTFYEFVDKVKEFLYNLNIPISYVIIEVGFYNEKLEPPKSTRLLIRLLKMSQFGVVKCNYYLPRLGTDNFESDMRGIIMVYSIAETSKLTKKTFFQIVNAIYFKYYQRWYNDFLDENSKIKYNESLHSSIRKMEKELKHKDYIEINGFFNTFPLESENKSRFKRVCKFFCVNGFLLIQVISKSVFKDNRKM